MSHHSLLPLDRAATAANDAVTAAEDASSAVAAEEAAVWATRVPDVPECWFARASTLHGVRHTQRVHVHAERLAGTLGWSEADTHLVLGAALWHDIGRTHDDVDPGHGALSAARAVEKGRVRSLAPSDAEIVLFAIRCHSLSDASAEAEALKRGRERGGNGVRRLAEPERALDVLWLLKDADALDRVRLAPWEAADPRQLRHPASEKLLKFAAALLQITGR
jgi:hypothetical protein